MITLNDIRRFFEEKDLYYVDKDDFMMVENNTLGDEEVLAGVFISCDEDLFTLECFLPKLIKLDLNEKIYATLNELNKRFKFFQITLESVHKEPGKYHINLRYCTLAQYIVDPEIAVEMLVRSLQIMDECYAEMMKARFSN